MHNNTLPWANMAIYAECRDWCASACTGVGVSLAQFRELQVTLCLTLHEGLTCNLQWKQSAVEAVCFIVGLTILDSLST